MAVAVGLGEATRVAVDVAVGVTLAAADACPADAYSAEADSAKGAAGRSNRAVTPRQMMSRPTKMSSDVESSRRQRRGLFLLFELGELSSCVMRCLDYLGD